MDYEISISFDESPSNRHFALHSHEHYEIYMFISGDCKYIVEENTYPLAPYDLIIIKKHELHRVFHNSAAPYRRYVLSVEPSFFSENGCGEYERIFTDFSAVNGNKINASTVRSTGIYDAFLRMIKYYNQPDGYSAPAVKACVTELLYLISTVKEFSGAEAATGSMKDVIVYLNSHYTENIHLDALSELFFTSKYHICRMFKQATGLTVHEYLTQKRLLRVNELKLEGASLTDAAAMAGFCNYSSFYRAYEKNTGPHPTGHKKTVQAARFLLYFTSSFKRHGKGYLIHIFQIAANRHAAGYSCNLNAEGLNKPRQVRCRCLTLHGQVGCHNNLGHILRGKARQKLTGFNIVRADTVHR